MKLLKRLAIIIFAFFILLVAAAVLIPIFFKDRLMATAKEEINKSVNATVDFEDINISLFRNFPNLRVGLKQLNVEGVDEFESISLAKIKSFDLVLDLISLFKGSEGLNIKSIYLDQPELQIIVLKNGKANYDIAKPDTTATASSDEYPDFLVNLKKYSIQDAKLLYDDKNTNTFVKLTGFDHEGSGQFSLNVYDLKTKTSINEISLSQGGITYLNHAIVDLDAIFNIDQSNSKYTLKENQLKVNDLVVNADGFVQLLENEQIQLKLLVTTPQNNFKNLLSLIPNAYIQGYENVKADGNFSLKANMDGIYDGVNEKYPAFQLGLIIENGNVKYPDLPLGMTDIQSDVLINSPSSNLNDMTVDVKKFNIKIGNNPISARFLLSTPIKDPFAQSNISGVLNLKDLSNAFPLEGVEEMAGIINANMELMAKMSFIEAGAYDKVLMNGTVSAQNIVYDSKDYPRIEVSNAQTTLSPQKVVINTFQSKLGKSDLAANGSIENILAYFSPEKTLKGQLVVNSSLFDANEWYQPSETATVTETETTEAEPVDIFDRFDFTVDATLGKIIYDTYVLENNKVKGHMTSNSLKVDYLSGQIKDTDYNVYGTINNMFDYLFKGGALTGKINFASQLVNLNQFMSSVPEDPNAGSTASTYTIDAILVPENINMSIDANVGKVIYDKIELKQVTGNLLVEDRTVLLNEVKGQGLGGDLSFSGNYDTRTANEPAFSMKYELTNLDFQQSFNALNTFQQIAPIGKFINGNFTTSLIMDGKIGKDLMPDLKTLNAKGFLETINGVIDGFKPLQIIGNTLDIKELKEKTAIAKTKNWFEIKNGTIEIKEFDYLLSDIAMKIGGTQSITQDINFQIKAKVPRSKIGNGAIGQGLGFLQKEGQKIGLNIVDAEFVNLNIGLTGTVTNPKIGVNLLGANGEKSLAETAKDQVKSEIANVKEEVVDSVKTVVNQKIEETKEELKKKAGDLLKDKVGDVLGSPSDSTSAQLLDTTTAKKVDDIKKELEKWNPFKNKKKKN